MQFPDYTTASTFPDYDALHGKGASNHDAQVTISYDSSSQATVTRLGCLPTTSWPQGDTQVSVTQVFTWHTQTGTEITHTNPQGPSDDTATWTDEWSPDNQLLRETSPLGTPVHNTTASIYDARGDTAIVLDIDRKGNTTTYTYPASDTDANRDRPATETDPLGSADDLHLRQPR